jgi:hypothetical protein
MDHIFSGAFVTMIIALLAATVLMADSTTAMQVASTSASAPTGAVAAAAPNTKPAQADGKTLVCRKEISLGTRLPTKKCRTVEQMAVQRQDDKAALDAAQRNITLEQSR